MPRSHARCRIFPLATLVLAGLAGPASAQTYPTQNITVIVAFPAGGLADIIARLVSSKLEARLKHSVVVENRGGAGGNIAAKAVFSAAPDGYTLLATTTGLAVNMTASKNRGFEMSDETKAGWEEEEAALERGDVDAAVEVNMRMWVDGPSRSPEEVDPEVRAKVAEMQRRAIEIYLEAGEEGDHQPLLEDWGERLGEISVPTLVVVGDLDRPEMLQIADKLESEIPGARRETIHGAAHVPSMERPEEFDRIVLEFLS